jgi:glycerate kinase
LRVAKLVETPLYSALVKILCAPDSFKDSLPANKVAVAMQRGIERAFPRAEIDCCPVADGGEGTASIVAAADASAVARRIAVSGPLGSPVDAEFFCLPDQHLAVLDMATAAGLMRIPQELRNVMRTTTYGVGELLLAACRAGLPRVVVGVGGSASNDGGCGMAQALGVRFFDEADRPISTAICGANLPSIDRIDASGLDPAVQDAEIVVACDVDNPLTGPNGSARVYAAQKGANDEQIAQLDRGLMHLAAIVQRDLGIDLTTLPRAGAAGGLAAGLRAFAGGRLASGVDIVLDAVQFDRRVRDCDLCLTGEGRLDGQTLAGKACLGVARRASSAGIRTVALVGSLGEDADRTLHSGLTAYELIGSGLPAEESMHRVEELLAATAERVVRRYSTPNS